MAFAHKLQATSYFLKHILYNTNEIQKNEQENFQINKSMYHVRLIDSLDPMDPCVLAKLLLLWYSGRDTAASARIQ